MVTSLGRYHVDSTVHSSQHFAPPIVAPHRLNVRCPKHFLSHSHFQFYCTGLLMRSLLEVSFFFSSSSPANFPQKRMHLEIKFRYWWPAICNAYIRTGCNGFFSAMFGNMIRRNVIASTLHMYSTDSTASNAFTDPSFHKTLDLCSVFNPFALTRTEGFKLRHPSQITQRKSKTLRSPLPPLNAFYYTRVLSKLTNASTCIQ